METGYNITQIGKISAENGIFSILIDKEYLPGLTNISGFNYLQIVWWGDKSDSSHQRSQLIFNKPYKTSPDKVGVFATRAETRPNPILITTVQVLEIDMENGIIYTPYIDADNGTAVLDIKPYHKLERIKICTVPQWCNHWPEWYEEAGAFDWQNEFNF